MIDVNLLPDSKLAKLKEKQSRQIALSISTLVIIISLGLPTGLFLIDFALQRVIASKQENINNLRRDFESKDNVQEILTVQNQLQKVADVEANRYYVSNLLSLIEYATPRGANVVSVVALTGEGTFEIQAQANSIAEANNFIDTLESIKIKDPNSPDGALISPFKAPLVENFSDDIDDPVTFNVQGVLDPAFGNVAKIDKFILEPYKLEQHNQKNESISVKEDN